MLTYIGITVGCICLIAFAVSLYFFHSKIKKQEETIHQMIEKQLRIEAIVTRPPPKQEIMSLFKSFKPDECNDCELEPIILPPQELPSDSPPAGNDDDVVVVGGGLINPPDEVGATPSC
jgi:hypothetical protein